jgi:hypothetical protein
MLLIGWRGDGSLGFVVVWGSDDGERVPVPLLPLWNGGHVREWPLNVGQSVAVVEEMVEEARLNKEKGKGLV